MPGWRIDVLGYVRLAVLGLKNLNILRQSRPVRKLLHFKARNPGLELSSNGDTTPIDKYGRTPLNYVPRVIKVLKRIKKGSSYYRRIFKQKKPPGKLGHEK